MHLPFPLTLPLPKKHRQPAVQINGCFVAAARTVWFNAQKAVRYCCSILLSAVSRKESLCLQLCPLHSPPKHYTVPTPDNLANSNRVPQGISPYPQLLPKKHRTTTRCPNKWLVCNCCVSIHIHVLKLATSCRTGPTVALPFPRCYLVQRL